MIHITPSFHYDVIYLKDSSAYLAQAFRILDSALELLETQPDYRYTVEQVFLLERYWKANPGKRERLKRFAREKRLDFAPGMYVMPDMNLIDGESLFRQIETGWNWLKRNLGVQPETCWIADCWGHPAQLPQILKKSGYRCYCFWRCMRPDWKKRLFRWKSPDGSVLPAVWLADGYSGIHFDPVRMENREEQELTDGSIANLREKADMLREFGAGDLLIPNGGDFAMPEKNLTAVVKKIAGSFPEGLRVSTVSEFVRETDFSNSPETDGEFNGSFQGTYTTNGSIKRRTNQYVRKLLALERLFAVSGKKDRMESVWKKVLKCQFHDTICGTVCDDGLREIERDLNAVAGAIGKRREPGGRFLFNPSGRTRTERVRIGGKPRLFTIPGLSSVPMNSGTVETGKSGPACLPCVFRTGNYTVRIGKSGLPESLIPANGIELAGDIPFGELSMQNDNGDNWLNFEGPLDGGCKAAAYTDPRPDPLHRPQTGMTVVRTIFPGTTEVTAEFRDGELVVRRNGQLGFWKLAVGFTMETVYSPHTPLIRFRTTLRPSGKHYRVRAVFPLGLGTASVTHGIAFGKMERPRTELPMNDWFDCRNPQSGLGVIALGIYGACVDGENHMMLTLFRSVAMEYKCDSVKSFQEGVEQTFEYAVYPHSDGASFSRISALAEDFAFPFLLCGKDVLPPFPLELPENVRLSSFRESRPGMYFLRLAEVCGTKTAVPTPGLVFAEADGTGKRTGEFHPANRLILNPFEIRNLQIRAER